MGKYKIRNGKGSINRPHTTHHLNSSYHTIQSRHVTQHRTALHTLSHHTPPITSHCPPTAPHHTTVQYSTLHYTPPITSHPSYHTPPVTQHHTTHHPSQHSTQQHSTTRITIRGLSLQSEHCMDLSTGMPSCFKESLFSPSSSLEDDSGYPWGRRV